MAIIEKMAKDNDYQVWCELVDESGGVGIYIEDGEVKNVEVVE
jgi:Mor family transcriptional regulator